MIDRQMLQQLLPMLMQMQQGAQQRQPTMMANAGGLAALERTAIDPTLSAEDAEQMRQERINSLTSPGGGAPPAGLRGRTDLDIIQDAGGKWYWKPKGKAANGQPYPWAPYGGK